MGSTKNIFFRAVRIILLLVYTTYSLYLSFNGAGVSYVSLLLGAFYISAMCLKEFAPEKLKLLCPLLGALLLVPLIIMGGRAFIPLAFFTLLELLSCFTLSIRWYLTLIPLALIPCPVPVFEKLILFLVTALLYLQNNYVVEPYRNQMFRDTLKEQDLKRDIALKESETKAELQRNMLLAENRILEERASLSQTLHDKLGHNINGSIYQLEASKLVMENDPEKAKSMIQAVIDQLRTGMDEIRAILRKERPEKKSLAMVQLTNLCEDCNDKGVEADLTTEGDMSLITDRQWEIILDNAYEAVSNSMKYSKCKHINIKIIVMNKMVRCSISDDGIGCVTVTDGMGIAGMRQRMRLAGGILDFETGANAGFTVNMLIPMQEE